MTQDPSVISWDLQAVFLFSRRLLGFDGFTLLHANTSLNKIHRRFVFFLIKNTRTFHVFTMLSQHMQNKFVCLACTTRLLSPPTVEVWRRLAWFLLCEYRRLRQRSVPTVRRSHTPTLTHRKLGYKKPPNVTQPSVRCQMAMVQHRVMTYSSASLHCFNTLSVHVTDITAW